jgi:hypothetical protein
MKPLWGLVVWFCSCLRFSCEASGFIDLLLISTGRHLVTRRHLSPSLVSLIGLLRDLLGPLSGQSVRGGKPTYYTIDRPLLVSSSY